MESKREQATINEIIEVISEIILKASIKNFGNKDVDENVKESSNIYKSFYK
jgi:hypothetical protein